MYDLILWDDEDDADGNYRHIVGTGEVTVQEVEDIISGHSGPWQSSRNSGHPSSSERRPQAAVSLWSWWFCRTRTTF